MTIPRRETRRAVAAADIERFVASGAGEPAASRSTAPGGGSFLQRKSGRELKKAAFYIEAERARAFKAWCALNQRDMSEVVDSLIAAHLARNGEKK